MGLQVGLKERLLSLACILKEELRIPDPSVHIQSSLTSAEGQSHDYLYVVHSLAQLMSRARVRAELA